MIETQLAQRKDFSAILTEIAVTGKKIPTVESQS